MKSRYVGLCFAVFVYGAALTAYAAGQNVSDTAAAGAPVVKKATMPATAARKVLVDINLSPDTQLKTLPDVDDAQARKIISGRPYSRIEQLKSRNIVPAAMYDKIKEMISVSDEFLAKSGIESCQRFVEEKQELSMQDMEFRSMNPEYRRLLKAGRFKLIETAKGTKNEYLRSVQSSTGKQKGLASIYEEQNPQLEAAEQLRQGALRPQQKKVEALQLQCDKEFAAQKK
jgi:hypothetical protein